MATRKDKFKTCILTLELKPNLEGSPSSAPVIEMSRSIVKFFVQQHI